MTELTDTLIGIIADYLGVEKENVNPDQTFQEMGFDSLELMEMLMQVEEKLDVKLNIKEDTNTVEKLAALIEETKNA